MPAKTSNEKFYLVFEVREVDREGLKKLLLEIESVMGMVPLTILDESEKPIQMD
ncbi:hypothetical protein C943_03314 [Mariniradius saccharolyticus AK6]|uniref:Uncharacterized protein n=1 Tax=Mariniradius saccharolyticus AK6 TaxID=1239962 RepID=M7Y1K8_9BACT|nr:hypothetical protein [Mariniradius saccharolyticus]EMS34627.1 hypothetical protein C943_03314 [Mariniradius saccharolyticus AK6]